MGIEYIPSDANDVWRILKRADYNDRDALEIEKMYNVLDALTAYAGHDVMQALALYSSIFRKEFIEITSKLSY